ncbi:MULTISPECIES: hypothetical protein [Oceanimonas]|uniref:hypothetical protein n=1 Tax=Oceanimonas TaxID=129577 RepID=UPI0003A83E58|nr:hypothetical protein [Oceanimonas smirnovii]
MRREQVGRPELGRRLHKFTLYLIVLQPLLLLLYGTRAKWLTLPEFVLTGCLLLLYSRVLVHLLYRQAKRSNDGYLVYPVVSAAMILALLMIWGALSAV